MFANPTFLESFYLKLYELLLIISQGVVFGREGYVNFESSLGIKSTFRAVYFYLTVMGQQCVQLCTVRYSALVFFYLHEGLSYLRESNSN